MLLSASAYSHRGDGDHPAGRGHQALAVLRQARLLPHCLHLLGQCAAGEAAAWRILCLSCVPHVRKSKENSTARSRFFRQDKSQARHGNQEEGADRCSTPHPLFEAPPRLWSNPHQFGRIFI